MFCVDTDRIYASGKSEGAGFAGVLACNATANSRIAAFAPVSGAFYPGNNDESTKGCKVPVPIPCDPQRCNVPFLEFHGGADFLAPIDGGLQRHECLPDIQSYMQMWVASNNLSSTPTETYNLSSVAEVYKYGDGLVTWVFDGPKVEHDWPWTVVNPDTIRAHSQPSSFNATPIIMEFFNNYTLA
jgi:poly(3-hydroxybutyrate) depolymerase